MCDISQLIDRMRYWCESVSLGYSQADRWNIRPGGNCDCSSLVVHCLQEAGFDTGKATTTMNLSSELTARGWLRLRPDGNPKPGDLLLNDKQHVAVYLGHGLLAQASISENGGINGLPGDQTGGETNVAPYYDYPWNAYLRYGGETMKYDTFDSNWTRDRAQEGAEKAIDKKMTDEWHTNWLRDRVQEGAQKALILQTGLDGRNVLDGVIQARNEIAELKTLITAQGATIDTLARAVGANPADIAATVQQAVKNKLDQLHITVEEVKP
ncbi:MAG: C40 family peptidase [Bifidobacterium sp.]|nr:C40 family peptidase [Bifidobacterium sp.]